MGGGGVLANHTNKKKGFAISGILYPLLILTLFLVVQMLFMLQTRKNVLDKARTELADSVNIANKIYTNEELSTLVDKLLADKANDNLLINGEFRVNQRGETNYALNNSSWTYTVDRFRAKGTGSISVNDGLTAVGSSANIQYIMEDGNYQNIAGKTATLSYSINGAVQEKTFTVNSSIVFNITLNVGQKLNWAKLELGSDATPLIPTKFGDELTRCQRYYEVIDSAYIFPMVGTPTVFYQMPSAVYKVTKRTNPKASFEKIVDSGGVAVSFTGTIGSRATSRHASSIVLSTAQSLPLFVVNKIELDSEIY